MPELRRELVRFANSDIEVFGPDGDKWAVANHISEALQYDKPRSLKQLVSQMRNSGELSEGVHFKYLPLPTGGGYQKLLVLSHRGIIRVCMRSDARGAIPFRDWAETVLYEVMKGYYVDPKIQEQFNPEVLTQILNQMNETLLLQGKMVQNLAAEVNEMREWRAQTFIPAQADNSYWPTPTERLKAIIPSLQRLPAYFNRGGSFDVYCALRHAQTRGGLLSQRNRRSRGKMPDYVIQPCPENDQFLREALEVWLVSEYPKQAKLKLLISNRSGVAHGAPLT